MEEFLKINWRLQDLTRLDPQDSFIPEDVIADSLVYKSFQDRNLFVPRRLKTDIFKENVYVPGQLRRKTFVKSVLDEWAHEQCLKALKLFQSGKDPSSYTASEKFYVDIFNKLKPQILHENAKYQSFVFECWQNYDQTNTKFVREWCISFGRGIWEAKWRKIYARPQFYKELSMINATFNENDSIIDFKCVNNVLDVGILAKFCYPNLKSPCFLTNVTLPSQGNKSFNSSLPVSQDQNVMKILETHPEVSLVISASSLKCISDNSDLKKRWMIPAVVKTVLTRIEDGSTLTRNVVFVDKPFSQNDISLMDFAYTSYKRLIKTNFCPFEAFNYENEDYYINNETNNDNKKSDGNESTNTIKNHKTIYHNASYKIWNIQKTYCHNNLIMKTNCKPEEFNVLIRSKLDACEQNEQGPLQPVLLKPKLEMQLNFGANIPSKSELAREWTSLFFAPFSVLYRVRISPFKGEVICLEKCNIQKVVAEAQTHYQYKPQLSLGILQKVFEELLPLEPGNYLLQHLPKHEAFLGLLKECSEPSTGKEALFDFHSEHNKVCISDVPKNWSPIDVNFILPSFEAINRMPGMFSPKQANQKKKCKKKNNTEASGTKDNTKKQ